MKSIAFFHGTLVALALTAAALAPVPVRAANGMPDGLEPQQPAAEEQPAAQPEAQPAPDSQPQAAAGEEAKPETKETKPATAQAGETEASQAQSDAGLDQREQQIFDRVKAIVKRLDAANGKEIEFPSKAIETAMRAEFMRRTENKNGIAWLKNKKLRDADLSVALDNMELLLTYTEKLASMNKKSSKKGKDLAKDHMEMKLLAAKSVIDRYNVARRGERGVASLTAAQGLSAVGKAELARRRKLVAGLVGGEDYNAVQLKKIDEYAKRYRERLVASVQEYDKLASAMTGGGSSGGSKKPKKK